jgi:hypothetical protein
MQACAAGYVLAYVTTLKLKLVTVYKNIHFVRYVSVTEANWLMLLGETVAVYCENHTEHTNTVCGWNAGFFILKEVVHIVTIGF